MAAKTSDNPRLAWSVTERRLGATPRLIDGDATFVAGEFLRHDADGLTYEGTTSGASGVGADKVDYLAGETVATAIGNDTTTKKVYAINEDDVFEMNELDGTVAESIVGLWYPMDVTSNVCTVDTTTVNTHAIFIIVEPKWNIEGLQNSSADTLALVYVQVLPRTLEAVKA